MGYVMGGLSVIATRLWSLPFLADAEQVPHLRRAVRTHLECWGLRDLEDAAELCVSELVTNVIKHVGPKAPSALVVSTRGTHLRIEVHDPNTRALPTLSHVGEEAEGGRGMLLVETVSDRWGVELTGDHKATWCELRISGAGTGSTRVPRLARAADVISLYSGDAPRSPAVGSSRLGVAVAEETAIDVITDLLCWFHAHGQDADDVLDRAQAHFDAVTGSTGST